MPPSDITQSRLLAHLSGYVNGCFLASGGESVAVYNPATASTIARVARHGAREAQAAVGAADEALQRGPTLLERRVWLQQIARAHADNREALAQVITLENGKPLAEARAEVDYAQGFYAHCARALGCLEPKLLPSRTRGHEWRVFARPAGVAGLIVPWNFPLAMLAKKASAALAAGAPIVVKPSEKTPLSSIALFHLLHQCDLPVGMVNLVFGDAPAIGKVLCEHPSVRVISFTGSTAVGKLLSAQAAPHIKRVALELGGNAPFIVLDDANLERAVEHLMVNKFRSAGQTCVCSNRIYVQRRVAERFVRLVAERVGALRVGAGVDPATTVGPLIDRAGFAKVRQLVASAVESGAQVVSGGVAPLPGDGEGFFYPPTVLSGVPASARCMREEVFGPVVAVSPFETDDEAVRAGNDTEYGLAAYVFSEDAARGSAIIERLRFGHVGLNCGTGPIPEAPFGGMKQSGLGREGGAEGIFEYVELQTVPTPLAEPTRG